MQLNQRVGVSEKNSGCSYRVPSATAAAFLAVSTKPAFGIAGVPRLAFGLLPFHFHLPFIG
jgi:hypothetical protein